jgi:alkylated DNA nucleotide flippase Atl1
MRECRDRSVPCQRVVAAGGAIGGYGGNVELKKSLLRAEGLTVVGRRIRGFALARWRGTRPDTEKRRTKRGGLAGPHLRRD